MDAYLGMILAVPYTFEPMGWKFCHGQLLQISQYDTLYALLGPTYGGDGVTTFALPDLRGRTPIGTGTRDGGTYPLGAKAGFETVPLAAGEAAAHSHAVMAASDPGDQHAPQGALLASAPVYVSGQVPTIQLSADSCSTFVGGGEAHQNRGPSLAMNWIICVEGEWPPRD